METWNRRAALKVAAGALPLVAHGSAIAQPARKKKALILSCDGGGIRGLLTARIIERLQKEVPFLGRVDLFAGTSTGGIIALALAHNITPGDLATLYRDRGREIFKRNNEWKTPEILSRIPESVGSLIRKTVVQAINKANDIGDRLQSQDLVHPRYDNKGLSAVLNDTFGRSTLGDLASGKPALVTTLRLCAEDENKIKRWTPLVLHNLLDRQAEATRTPLEDGPTPATKLVDAALATSAAPTYFPPHDCPGFGFCVDGGLVANCPASIALGLWLRANPGTFDDIRILSIGTGYQSGAIDIGDKESSPFNDPAYFGPGAWLYPVARGPAEKGQKLTPAFPLISALLDASSASHNYICKQAMRENYCRVQVKLPRPIDLDDTSRDALKDLEDASLIPQEQWSTITRWLRDSL